MASTTFECNFVLKDVLALGSMGSTKCPCRRQRHFMSTLIDTSEAKLSTSDRWQQLEKLSQTAASVFLLLCRSMEQVGQQHPTLTYDHKLFQLKVYLAIQLTWEADRAIANPHMATHDREALRACTAEH